MLKKKKNRIFLIVLAVLIGFVLILNTNLESILKDYIATELDVIGMQNEHTLGIGDVDVHFFRGNISVTDFYFKPNDELFASFAKGETEHDAIHQVFVSKISLSGLELFKLIVKREVILDKIEIEELNFNFYQSKKENQVHEITKGKKPAFSLDSIRLSGIDKIELAEIEIANYGVHILDASEVDTLSSYAGKDFLIKGLEMDALKGKQGYFRFDNSALEMELIQQQYQLEDGLYAASFDNLQYSYQKQKVQLINFEFKPIISRAAFASKFSHIYSINEATIDTLLISGIDSYALIHSGVLSIQQLEIIGLNSSIFMDKSKPWDVEKVTDLPQMALEKMRQPLHLGKIKVHNSSFTYSEKLQHTEELVKVNFENLQSEVSFITSIHDSLQSKKSLKVKLSADLLNTLPFSMDITMPYNTADHSFYASGYTKGITNFKNLNPTIFPAIGMKFKNGEFDGVTFKVQGNPNRMTGELTMLYQDLEVEVFKKNKSENKKVSWIANTFMKRSNPNKRGKTIVAGIDFKRIKYKGFANYIWKSVESGIVNSLNPIGKHKKENK